MVLGRGRGLLKMLLVTLSQGEGFGSNIQGMRPLPLPALVPLPSVTEQQEPKFPRQM